MRQVSPEETLFQQSPLSSEGRGEAVGTQGRGLHTTGGPLTVVAHPSVSTSLYDVNSAKVY